MKKNLLTIILLSTIGCSTKVPTSIQNNFTYKYDGQPTGIEKLINVDGYYCISVPETRRKYVKPWIKMNYETVLDTFYMNYFFFKDGMYLENFGFKDCVKPSCM